jgi:hypothetical protein
MKPVRVFCLLFSLAASVPLHAQDVVVPVGSQVYPFLDRVAGRELARFDDVVKPISRRQAADLLTKLESRRDRLTPLEREELDWWKREFHPELVGGLRPEPGLSEGRWHLYQYRDSLFSVTLDPIFAVEASSWDGKWNTRQGILGGFYGSIGEHIGFSFRIFDHVEKGDSIDAEKAFTPLTGFNYKKRKGRIDYTDMNALLTAKWSWGRFSFGKEYLQWGSGRQGQVILSNKAPSFPFIAFDLEPASWLHFHYVHAWLSSNVPDSSTIYQTLGVRSNGRVATRINQREKYLAANLVSIIPWDGVTFSIGNSIVYSDGGVRPPFLIPFIWYYKGLDHNFYGSTENDGYGNNGQLFFDVSVRRFFSSHFYASLFIDEIHLDKIFAEKHRNQVAYTLGVSNHGSLIDDLTLAAEYTRVMPGTYLNYIQTQTYEHASYVMGHWVGQNADQLHLSARYSFLRGLELSPFFELARKGSSSLGTDFGSQLILQFLYKPVLTMKTVGLNVRYEPFHDVYVRGYIRSRSLEWDPAAGAKTTWDGVDVSATVGYGL